MVTYKDEDSITLMADPRTNKYLRFTNIPNSEQLFGKMRMISIFTANDITYIEEVDSEVITNGESE